jgi:deazaflavin-dependent oxidoreductase (nitroreductase family)
MNGDSTSASAPAIAPGPAPGPGPALAAQQVQRPAITAGPSWFPRIVLRPLIKVLNPLIVRRAGRPGFDMAAQVRHVGRRSGRPYATPVTVRRAGDVVMIGLTFGSQSDWARNVLAAGRCSMLIDGVEYEASSPAVVDLADAADFVSSAYTGFERLMLRRVLGIRQFMRLILAPASGEPGGGAPAGA